MRDTMFWNNFVTAGRWNQPTTNPFSRWVFREAAAGMPSPSGAEYRLHAAECLELAERASEPDDKARLIEMAQKFLELANRLEQREP